MKRGELGSLVVAFLVAFFAIGIPYWVIPYGKVELPSTLVGVGLTVAALAALAVSAARLARARLAALVVGAAAPAAVLLRVIVDCSRDPTAHNLWPFEIVLAGGVGLLASTAGAILGAVIARFRTSSEAS
jgi:hypothetical protein